jgi:L-methionine (R)-S-oxide reductase
MAESLAVSGSTRKDQYTSLLPQLKALVEGETDKWAALGNIMSAIKYGMNFFWVGLYVVKNNELVLSSFQGTVACTRIAFGKGVCGHCWKEKKIIIVDNVDLFAGHIACSSESKSEIVLPVFDKKGEVAMVFDVDSEHLAHFSQTDEKYLKEVVLIIEKIINA